MRVYLDHNATSPLRPEAAEAVAAALAAPLGNASSLHAEGRASRALLEEARSRVASLLSVRPREIVFTSGGSESIAAAVRGACERATGERRRIVVGSVEHSAVLESARRLARWGFVADEVPCGRSGVVNADVFAARLGADVALAALQAANNETGVVQPVEAAAAACRAWGVPLLVDAVQAVGKVPFEPWPSGADLVAISGHKLGGPQGTGALAIREGTLLAPLIPGGAQELRRRGGTEAVAMISGLGAACAAALRHRDDEAARLAVLRERIEARLRAGFPGVHVHGEAAPRLPNTVCFSLPGAPGEALVIALDVEGFALSTGSACASGAVEPSHVMRAMGLAESEARGAVRVSLGWSTSDADVDRFLVGLPAVVGRVRSALSA